MPSRRPALGLLALALLPATAAALGPPPAPLRQQVDRLLEADPELARHKAPRAGDAELLRRATLDLTGTIPSSAAARAYLADRSPDKYPRLVARLLASPEHARHMAVTFDVMLMERLPARHVPQAAWHEFLRASFAANRPWDWIAREVLSGDEEEGKSRHRVKFFLERNAEPNVVTRDISRLFLGTNLQCAQCHDHPRVEEYKQEHYYGLYAFVGRTTMLTPRGRRGGGAALSEKADGEVTFQSVFDPKKVTRTAVPRVPGMKAIVDATVDRAKLYVVAPTPAVAGVPRYSRRAQLAGAIARADNAAFRRNIANRLWAQLMGRGLVEPLDMDSAANPPTHPELLDVLAADLAARRFDMRGFLRELALSEAYQRSSEMPASVEAKKVPLYAVAQLKPLTPEQLAWALMEATGLVESQRLALAKAATEANLYARLSANEAPFVRAFGGAAGQAQAFDARMDQALFVANGPTVRGWLAPRAGGLLQRLAKLSGKELADELYLSVFTRHPDDDERRELAEYLKRRPDGLADYAWALLASTEVRFNH